eukprot:6235712-Ditylum_brightwellii.AAC.1
MKARFMHVSSVEMESVVLPLSEIRVATSDNGIGAPSGDSDGSVAFLSSPSESVTISSAPSGAGESKSSALGLVLVSLKLDGDGEEGRGGAQQ